MTGIIPQHDTELTAQADRLPDYEAVRQAVSHDVAATTDRVYQQTYRAWQAYCEEVDLHPLALTPDNVRDFLVSKASTRATRNRQLAALRKLIEKAHTATLITAPDLAPRLEGMRKLLADMKAPAPSQTEQDSGERRKVALTPAQADKLLRYWDGPSERDMRNRALIAVLLLTGIRRSEAAALCWHDVDFENGVLAIRHGKGDKARYAAIAGDFALDALAAWLEAMPEGRTYIFPPVRKGGRLTGVDKPISGTDVYRIVKATQDGTGVEFKPHDCRRTFITEGLNQGASVSLMQAQAGHSSGETTLRYAEAPDARQRRKKLRLRYG